MPKILYARGDAARLLAISLRKLDYLIKEKVLKVVKIGKRTLVSRTELERFGRDGTGKLKQPLGGRHAE